MLQAPTPLTSSEKYPLQVSRQSRGHVGMQGEELFEGKSPRHPAKVVLRRCSVVQSGSLPAGRRQDESSKRIWKAWVGLKACASSWK